MDNQDSPIASLFEEFENTVKASNPVAFIFRGYKFRLSIEKCVSEIASKINDQLGENLNFSNAQAKNREGRILSALYGMGIESKMNDSIRAFFSDRRFSESRYFHLHAYFSIYLESRAKTKKPFFNEFLSGFSGLRKKQAKMDFVNRFISSHGAFEGFLTRLRAWLELADDSEAASVVSGIRKNEGGFDVPEFLRKWFESHLASLPKDSREDFVKSVFEEDFAIDESAFESFDLTNLLRVSRSMRIRTRESGNDDGIDAPLINRVLKLARDLPPGIPAFLRIFEIVSQCHDSNARADIWERVRKTYLPELSV